MRMILFKYLVKWTLFISIVCIGHISTYAADLSEMDGLMWNLQLVDEINCYDASDPHRQ